MGRYSDEETDLSESDFDDYVYKVYKRLKHGEYRTKISDARYRCPFCFRTNKKEYSYNDFLQHAKRMSKGSKRRDFKPKCQHTALVDYLEKYHRPRARPEPSGANDERVGRDKNEKFVWPWKGIVANIPIQIKNGRSVGESGGKLKDEFARKGFNPLKVVPLWSHKGHSGYAILNFNMDWSGLANAMMFEKAFESDHQGKKDWQTGVAKSHGDKLFAWVAREDDYNSKDIIGDHLRKNGDLRSIGDIECEDERKTKTLVSNLTSIIEEKEVQCTEMKTKLKETSASLNGIMVEKDEMTQYYHEEMRRRQEEALTRMEKIFVDHEKMMKQLEYRKEKLELQRKELQEREFQDKNERMRLFHLKKMNEMATLGQKRNDENVLKLADEHKREKEALHKKIIALEKELDRKQALELEIQRLRGTVQVMEHLGADGDAENNKRMEEIKEELKDKEEELEEMEDLNQTLIIKERKINDELQEARKELINGLQEAPKRGAQASIGVRRMGELDEKPFHVVASRKYSKDEAFIKAKELCSLWESYISDPSWYPFKIISDKGSTKRIIDEDDEKLKSLRNEEGDEVFEAVATALLELIEYNPSGLYPIRELWNFKEDRPAKLKEGAEVVIKQWRAKKRKKYSNLIW